MLDSFCFHCVSFHEFYIIWDAELVKLKSMIVFSLIKCVIKNKLRICFY